jgi:hypothetical protein
MGQGFLSTRVQVLHVRSWVCLFPTTTLDSGGIFPAGVVEFPRARGATAVTLTHKHWQLAGQMRWQGSFISLDRALGQLVSVCTMSVPFTNSWQIGRDLV